MLDLRAMFRWIVPRKSDDLAREALQAAVEGAELAGNMESIVKEAKERKMDPIAMLAHQVRRASFHREAVRQLKGMKPGDQKGAH